MSYTIIDLSQEIYQGMPVFAPHQPTMIFKNITHEESLKKMGFMFSTNNLLISEHGPTHTDAPYEYDPNGPTIEKIGLDRFFGPAICLELSSVPETSFITCKDIDSALLASNLKIERGDIVLLHTAHYERAYGTDGWLSCYAGLDFDAAVYLAKSGVKIVGIDAPSIDKTGDLEYSAHKACRQYGMLNAENLCNLDKVAGKRFLYIGLPLKIRGGSGSPVRAAAVLTD